MQYFFLKGVGANLTVNSFMKILGFAVELWTVKASCAGNEIAVVLIFSLHKLGCEDNELRYAKIVAAVRGLA